MSSRRSSQKRKSGGAPVDVPLSNASFVTATAPARPRVTPRNSTADEGIVASSKETPYNSLRQLANMPSKPITPQRGVSTTGPPSIRRSSRKTPAAQPKTPAGPTQAGSVRPAVALTPHARAAVRVQELRRLAAITPRRDRPQNGRQQQRETPRNDLRVLSRIIPTSRKPMGPSPKSELPPIGRVLIADPDDDLDDVQGARPRLSMALDIDDDDSMLLPPMRSAIPPEEENMTQRSVELPRRVSAEQPAGRLSRGSFGSVRTSDRFDDLINLELNALGNDNGEGEASDLIPQGDFDEDLSNLEEEVATSLDPSYLEDGTGRVSLVSRRTSDIRPETILEDDTEHSFVLPVPQRDSFPGRPSIGMVVSTAEKMDHYKTNAQLEDTENSEDSEIDQVGAEEGTILEASRGQVEKLTDRRSNSHRVKKRIKVSKHGITYSSLPAGAVKRLSTIFLRTGGNGKGKLSKDTLDAIMQASDWFFEQVSDDLGIYAQHAGRKTIDESDVVTLMKRQRQTNATTTAFALAQRYLPRELLQDLRMAERSISESKRSRRLDIVDEQEEDA